MRQYPSSRHDLSGSIDADAADIETRKALLNFTDKDAALLKSLHRHLQPRIKAVAREVFLQLLSLEEAQPISSEAGLADRMKSSVLAHFNDLTAGCYDREFAHNRVQSGRARIGLTPQWIFGAYYKYLAEMMPEIWRLHGDEPTLFNEYLFALLKVILLDMGLVVDSYIYTDRQQILQLKAYAEKIVESIPSGLLVLDRELNIVNTNRFFTAMFSLSADDVLGQPVEKLLPIPNFHALAQAALKSEVSQRPLDVTLRGKNFHISMTCFQQQTGEARLLLVVEDQTQRRRAEAALRETQERFRLLVEGVEDYSIVMLDAAGRVISWNPGAERITGYGAQDIVGKSHASFYPKEEIDKGAPQQSLNIATVQGRYEEEGWRLRRDGSRFWANVILSSLWDDDGRLRGFAKITRDITERRQAQEAHERLARILQETPDLVATADVQGTLLYLNKAGREMLDIGDDEAVSKFHLLDFHPQEGRQLLMQLGIPEAIKNGVWSKETNLLTREGKVIPVSQVIIAHKLPDGQVAFFSTIVRDVSERKAGEARLAYMAHHDSLTGLPNRSLLTDRLNQVLAHVRRHKQKAAIIFVDLDRFKMINDTLGHDAGDGVLQTIAARLQAAVREEDTVARLGGDEFVVVLTELTQAEDVSTILEKLHHSFSQPVMIDGQELFISASLGISIYPDDGQDAKTLLKNADSAMYRAKESGRNQFRFYTKDMNARSFERLALENSLRRALDREEFLLHYQPKLVLDTGRIIGMEALLRWQHPDMGLVPPARFIPLLEETGLIIPVSEWVLRTACLQTKAWQAQGLSSLRVAVNLSGRQFKQPGLLSTLTRILDESGLSPSCLELELTESILMQNTAETLLMLNQFSHMEVKLSIDDFGTGYSSLSYLKRFPVSSLKIDKSFIRDITSDPDDAAITAAITAMAHNLRILVIAEGVETREQLQFLRDNQCDEIQGNYFSGPLPADAFAKLVAGCQHAGVFNH